MTEYIFSDNQEGNEYYRLRLLEEAFDKNTKYVKQANYRPIKIAEGMIQDFKYDEPFDLIHARYVFIHNTDAANIISKTSELLKPGGVLVIEEPEFTVARWIDDRYKKGANDPRSLATYYATISIVGTKA